MFTNPATIYKVLQTRKGAENYVARWNIDDVEIQEIDGRFWVVAE
jgi:hypothetical protein